MQENNLCSALDFTSLKFQGAEQTAEQAFALQYSNREFKTFAAKKS